MGQNPTIKDKQDSEQDARIALLQHYSSKSSNQVTNILTIAVAFFAFVTSISTLNIFLKIWTGLFYELILTLFIGFGVHSVFRLLYWGERADKAVSSDIASTGSIEAINKCKLAEWAVILRKLKKDYRMKRTEKKDYYDNLNKDFKKLYYKYGCPRSRNFMSISYNMKRLTLGIGNEITRKRAHNRLLCFNGTDKGDPAFFSMGISLLVFGILDFFKYPLPKFILASVPLLEVLLIIFGLSLLGLWLRNGIKELNALKNDQYYPFDDKGIGICSKTEKCAELICRFRDVCGKKRK